MGPDREVTALLSNTSRHRSARICTVVSDETSQRKRLASDFEIHFAITKAGPSRACRSQDCEDAGARLVDLMRTTRQQRDIQG